MQASQLCGLVVFLLEATVTLSYHSAGQPGCSTNTGRIEGGNGLIWCGDFGVWSPSVVLTEAGAIVLSAGSDVQRKLAGFEARGAAMPCGRSLFHLEYGPMSLAEHGMARIR